MTTDAKTPQPGDDEKPFSYFDPRTWRTLAKAALLGAVLVLALALAVPPLIGNNTAAQILFSLLMAFVTTLTSVIVTIRFAKRQSQDELTRYGLQAYRNLNNLAIKVSAQVGNTTIEGRTLTEWQLDIEQAKQSWQDLMREVFELQARLELETAEIKNRYQIRLASATNPEERSALLRQQDIEVAERAARAPLPVAVSEMVNCPICGSGVAWQVGTYRGDTARPTCGRCGQRFYIHRQADGSLLYGGGLAGDARATETITTKCPAANCTASIMFSLTDGKPVTFERTCPACHTHIKFSGTASAFDVTDLGKSNTTFKCPYCQHQNNAWVSPDREVRFAKSCESCMRTVQLQGTRDLLNAAEFQQLPADAIPPDDETLLAASAANALAGGNMSLARELYSKAASAGMSPAFLAVDLAMVDIAEGKFDESIARLSKLNRAAAGPAMLIQMEVLQALAVAGNGGSPDLGAVTEALRALPQFTLEKSCVRFLKAYLRENEKLTDSMQLVFGSLQP
jgi:transposase-like protein